jgi:type II secretory pathway component PulM
MNLISKEKLKQNKTGGLRIDTKMSQRDKKLLMIVGVIFILFLSYYFLYRPMSAKIDSLQAEKAVMDETVAKAENDLRNEAVINKTLDKELVRGKESAAAFFPKVYPYKDRYALLLKKS